MMFFDKKNKRLAMLHTQATPDFWDAQWKKDDLMKAVSSGKTYHFIKKITQKYLPEHARILEGGCGTGQVVYSLQSWGYEAYGVDYAPETIQTVRTLFPHLNLSVQDVRHMNFPNAYFDGYWSLGVIEHFWNGYDEIIKEAHRVLKPGGFLFLTFPVMSPVRKLKAILGKYPPLDASIDTQTFYEFMLDKNKTIETLKNQGFACVYTMPYDAVKGLKDDVAFLQKPFQKLYQSKTRVARALRYLLTLLLARWTGHMILLVCKKTSSTSS